jgi:hypothetical protein
MKYAVVLSIAFAAGCAGWVVVGSKQDFMDNGLKRASFDMSCPAEKLTVTDLGQYSMGVEGCGKRASYKAVTGSGWVLNSQVAAQ